MRGKGHLLFANWLLFIFIMSLVTVGTAMGQGDQTSKKEGQQNKNEFTLDEITVTAQYQKTNLQKTPIAITAITGDMLEDQNILSVEDLGLIVPNANIHQMGNLSGPTPQIGLRGVDQSEFIPAFEPGVGIYVDGVYQGTLTGSTMDLLDLERVEVLRGPQGTLFGKNSLGGAIRLISKVPRGDNTGHMQVTGGNYNRLEFSGSYDFSLIDNLLFARVSANSKRIDGYMDRLDYACQMKANGTPELAGSLPSILSSDKFDRGDCKIGEKGGSQSDAAKIMLRYVPSDKLEFNFGFDYTNVDSDPGAEVLVRGRNPNPPAGDADLLVQQNIIDPTWNTNPGDALSILGDSFVTGSYYSTYETYEDPILHKRYPDKQTEEYKNMFAKVDYDITDSIHLKGIFGYREYKNQWAVVNFTPFAFNAFLVDQNHDQTSYELRLNGKSFGERLDWTTGFYYFKSNDHLGGYIGMGTFGLVYDFYPTGFNQNDNFHNESKSVFAHTIFSITKDLSLTTGARYTDESKEYDFDHPGLLEIAKPLRYGQTHWDYKLSLNYQFTNENMAYAMVSTGFRSEGANPKPYFASQLQQITGEKIVAYEIGSKNQFFDNRLRVNAAAFLNDYNPRLFNLLGLQCNNALSNEPPQYVYPFPSASCPAGSYAAENGLTQYANVYISAPGKAKGVELDVTAVPINNLNVNASFGYYTFKTDLSYGDPGYMNPNYKTQPEYTYNLGAQYRFLFNNGSTLVPRIDMFHQGESNNGGLATQEGPIEPYHVIPAYTVYNARLTYMPSDVRWSLSLEVKNLFDSFYWITIGADREDDGVTPAYMRRGVPSPPRMFALTLRYNFF